MLEAAFDRLSKGAAAKAAQDSADLVAKTLITHFDDAEEVFPAVFEKDNQSRIIPAIEGFVYPLFLGMHEVTYRNGRFAKLHERLAKHLRSILRPGVCLDPDSGGWKMSSTSRNTWFSKIAIAQHVIRMIYPDMLTDQAARADAVHADWQRNPGCGEFAMCDQIDSRTGVTCGSRYYPRGVTAFLWLNETRKRRR